MAWKNDRVAAGSARPVTRLWTLLAMTALAAPVHAQPTVTNLGVLPGGTISSGAAMSADGSTAAGSSFIPGTGYRPFRWTASGGMENLGILPSGRDCLGRAISADGSVVVGSCLFPASPHRAFRWTAAGGMQSIALPTGGTYFSDGYAVSADGSVVVGQHGGPQSLTQFAFRWTPASGVQDVLGLPNASFYFGYAVSADGSVVAGSCNIPSDGHRAFRWTTSTAMKNLGALPGVLPGQGNSEGYAMSSDGSTVVGTASNVDGSFAYRRLVGGGLQSLGVLPGGVNSSAEAANADGTVIAGQCFDALGNPRAFLWTAVIGMVDLNTYLPALGIDTTGWTLTDAHGISADGRAITGTGTFNGDQRAFVVSGLPVCALAVTSQPANVIACPSGNATFVISASGTSGPVTAWQWRPLGTPLWLNVNNGTNIDPGTGQPAFSASGATQSSLTLTNAVGSSQSVSGGRREIHAVVSNTCASATSSAAVWTICPADFNCSGVVNINDIFDFLAGWFAGAPAADFNGVGGIGIQDIFDFLAAWFAGCP